MGTASVGRLFVMQWDFLGTVLEQCIIYSTSLSDKNKDFVSPYLHSLEVLLVHTEWQEEVSSQGGGISQLTYQHRNVDKSPWKFWKC